MDNGRTLMRLALLFLAACGSAPVALVQPNTHTACARAVRCGTFAESEYGACVACLEHVDPVVLNKLREEYGELPPLEQVDCDTLRTVCEDTTNIASCVRGKWWGA
jgi:hypothetical protein